MKRFFQGLCIIAICTTAFSVDQPQPTPNPQAETERLAKAIALIQRYYIKPETESRLMDDALTGMVKQLDPHSEFLTGDTINEIQATVTGKFVGIGIELTAEQGILRVVSPIDGTPAAKAGIKPGDYIIKINDNLVQDLSINDAISQIKGKANSFVTLTILRKNTPDPLIMKIKREEVQIQTVQSKLLAPGYGYIRIAFFQGPVAAKVRDAITSLKKENRGKLKGIILDLRNNPGGLLDASGEVLNLFLDKKNTKQYNHLLVYTKGRTSDANVAYYTEGKAALASVPMVALINEGSASASEIVAGALQDYKRALIVGTRSFGKGSVQTIIPLDSNSILKLTTALYYTPAGREIQARGIEPDVLVPNLAVNTAQKNKLLPFDEMSYQNHIANQKDKATLPENTMGLSGQPSDLISLAQSDYQLYESLILLKGIHALQ